MSMLSSRIMLGFRPILAASGSAAASRLPSVLSVAALQVPSLQARMYSAEPMLNEKPHRARHAHQPTHQPARQVAPAATTPAPTTSSSSSASASADASSTKEDKPSFASFPLAPALQKRLQEVGFQYAFPVQAATFPHSLNGKDVIAKAFTGSGKTLAFTIPIIQKLGYSGEKRKGKKVRAVVLSPTRELGLQIFKEVEKISDFIKCLAVYGGTSISAQQRELQRGVDIVIGTPGRVNDLIERGDLDLSGVQIFVLDEADQMMGADFRDQVEAIMKETPPERQTFLFSATMPSAVKNIARNFMKDPVLVDLLQENRVPTTVEHLGVLMRPGQSRAKVMTDLIQVRDPKRVVVFCNTKNEASKVAMYLSGRGIPCDALHSDLSQFQREQALDSFRNGTTKVITATDVAARGIDVPDCDLVLHSEPPNNGFEFYIHRSGRTGRAGKSGTSIVLYGRRDRDFVYELENIGVKLKNIPAPSMEEVINLAIKAETQKMSTIPQSIVDKVLPEAERLLKEQGVAALAKALILSTKSDNLEEPEPEEDFGRSRSRDRFGNDRDRDRRSSGDRFGNDRDRRFRSGTGGGDRDRDRRPSGDKFGSDRRHGDRSGSFQRHDSHSGPQRQFHRERFGTSARDGEHATRKRRIFEDEKGF